MLQRVRLRLYSELKLLLAFGITLLERKIGDFVMALITRFFQNAGRKILDRSFDLVEAWYEATKFAPTNPHL